MPVPQDPHSPDSAAGLIQVDSFVGDTAVYAVHPQAWTCTCEEWHVMRAGFKERDVRRLCPHLMHVFHIQPQLLPGNFKERDRRIVERLEPMHLGYPICRRIVSMPLPPLAHQSGPDSADIFFPRDRATPWVSVLSAEGLFHYHPDEDRWANRFAPSDPGHRQALELRIHKALHQESGDAPPAGQAAVLDADGRLVLPVRHTPRSPHSSDVPAAHAASSPRPGEPWAAPGESWAESNESWALPDETMSPLNAATPPQVRPGAGAAAPNASPHRPRHFDLPNDSPPDRAADRAPGSRPAAPPSSGKGQSQRSPGCLILALALACALGALFFLYMADVSVSSITQTASKLFQRDTPPPPLPGASAPGPGSSSPGKPAPGSSSPGKPAVEAPPAPGLQTAPGGHWPQTEQAKDILKLIQANPSQGRYTITKKLPDSVVLFGVDLDVQSIYRIERFSNGTESRDSWLGHTKFRLESAAQGGTLADVPK